MPLCEAIITEHSHLTGGYRLLRLAVPEIAAAAVPGQFVHLRIPTLEPTALRRPLSIYQAGAEDLVSLYKPTGRGTKRLSQLEVGSTVSLIGPLGHGFPLDIADRLPVLIGGGYGVAPLVFLASRLPAKGVALIGGRSSVDLLCMADFEALGWSVAITTEDGSCGTKGKVTDLLPRYLDNKEVECELFACGPRGMLRAVGECAVAAGRRAWLSLDNHMACGIGACLACVQQVRQADGSPGWARVCKDGPVFEASRIIWEELL